MKNFIKIINGSIFQLLLVMISLPSGAQDYKTMDSLQKVLRSAKNDTSVISVYLQMGEVMGSYEQDSAIHFYRKGLEVCARNNSNQIIAIKIFKLKGDLLRSIGNIFIQRSDYEMALDYINKALTCYLHISDDAGTSKCYKSIGAVRYYQGDAVKSIEAFQSAMKIAEKSGNMESYSDCINNIGMVHYQQDNNKIALENFNKALEIRKKLGIKPKIAESYNNIGMIYSDDQDVKSLEYFFKSLELFEELDELIAVGRIYNNIGVVYKDISDFNNAEKYFLLSLKNRRKMQDRQHEALVLGNLSDISIKKGDYYKAIMLADSSLVMAKEIGSLQVESNAYGFLFDAYERMGDYKKSLYYHKLLKSSSDSLSSAAKFETISDMEAKYQNEKKQLEIANLTKEKSLQRVELKNKSLQLSRQRNILLFIGAGLLMVIVFSILLFRQSHARKKANILLAKQNFEIQQKNEEISSQRDEIESQRDLVFQQKEQIVVIHKKVTDSINYAKRIQEAILPTKEAATGLLGDHFIFFKPKDIVSGDFYWATRINEWILISVADCTGHGVPGAFMSMLGISYLNEIVRKKEIIQASHVLDYLRESVIEALQQKGQSGEQKDGMDIAFCVLNKNNNTLQYSGANNSLFIVTNDKQLIEISGDKQPVAIYDRMKPFTNHEIKVNNGDCLYMATDGFEDQFGGAQNKKFMVKQLKELFATIADKPMNLQNEILKTTFENWKGEHEQIDDVTILGLKI